MGSKTRFSVLGMLAALAALVLPSGAAAAADPPAVGSQAPDFNLPTQEGKPAGLKDFRGKWVVLYFYPKDATPGCTVEARNFERDLARYEQANAVVLGVSVDSAESHKEFCAKEGLSFKLLSDSEAKVSSAYGSLSSFVGVKVSSRNTFLIDPAGKVAKVFLKVQPREHSEEVLSALAELQKG